MIPPRRRRRCIRCRPHRPRRFRGFEQRFIPGRPYCGRRLRWWQRLCGILPRRAVTSRRVRRRSDAVEWRARAHRGTRRIGSTPPGAPRPDPPGRTRLLASTSRRPIRSSGSTAEVSATSPVSRRLSRHRRAAGDPPPQVRAGGPPHHGRKARSTVSGPIPGGVTKRVTAGGARRAAGLRRHRERARYWARRALRLIRELFLLKDPELYTGFGRAPSSPSSPIVAPDGKPISTTACFRARATCERARSSSS